MWQRLNLFWRYFITGFICILLSVVATVLVMDVLETRDNQATFLDETLHILQEVEQDGLDTFLAHVGDDFPYEVAVNDAFSGQLNELHQFGDNHFEVTYHRPDLGYVTLRDKYEPPMEVKHPEEAEIEAWFSLLERVIWMGAIVLFLGFSFYLVNRQTQRHIHELVDASKAISEGDFDTRVPTQSPEPIQQLAKQLDTTRQNIKHLVEKERTLAFAIPHELRTPVSKIRLALDLSRDHETVEDYEHLVEDLDAYTDELEQLISDLLALAKTNDDVILSNIALNDMLTELADEYRFLYPNKTITINNNVNQILSGELQLRLMLSNLFQNAFKYADSMIEVSVKQQNDSVTIRIANDGKTIPAGMRERIFDPFTRVDASRNRQTGGIGLGLALVKQAVSQLGGCISLLDNAQTTCFEVVLKDIK